MAEDVLLQAADAAEFAGVTPSAIGRAVRDGRLRAVATTPRGTRLFRPDDVRAYVDARGAQPVRAELARLIESRRG